MMKDRLVTFVGAGIALFVLIAVLFGRGEPTATRPTSVEDGRNGFAALSRWLTEAGVDVVSFRHRFDRLTEVGVSAVDPAPSLALRGNVLVTAMPYRVRLREDEARSLEAWLRNGNTVLVLAALDDAPEWTTETDAIRQLRDLELLTGLRFRRHVGSDEGPLGLRVFVGGDDFELALDAVRGQPLMAGVRTLRGLSDRPRTVWLPTQIDGGYTLARLATERRSGVGAAWVRRVGNGYQIIVAATSIFSNHMIGSSDAGAFVSNVLRHHLAGDGAVLFDDLHQGLSAVYDPNAFFMDPRLHRSLLFLVAAWFVYVVGSSNRFAPPRAARIEPRQRDHLEAVGGFLARRLDRREAGLAMIDGWLGDVKRLDGFVAGESPWQALRRIPTLGHDTVDQLEAFHRRLSAGHKVDLVRLHNTLKTAREAIR